MPLANKVALITGASRGLGAAIATVLAQKGVKVAGTATTQAGADKITHMLKEQGLEGQGFVLNVTDQNSIDSALENIKEKLGAPEILVNNAGITRDNLMLRMKNDEWQEIIDTNLNSIFRLTKACLKPMVKARWGRIINISSVVGTTGNAGQANYSAAKAGMLGFSKSLAQEIATRGITVNVIAPGMIDTDMTQALTDDQKQNILRAIPMQQLGQPEDIANTVAFLASCGARYITGQTLHVNGGMFMN